MSGQIIDEIQIFIWKDFWWYKIWKLLKVACSYSRSFSTYTHREKTSVWRKAIKRAL